MNITMVKKILQDGSDCKKCREVAERLEANNEMKHINRIVFADVRDETSEGFELALKHGVEVAPFFIVEDKGNTAIYKSYMQLRKQVFGSEPTPEDKEIEEKRQAPPPEDDYDFI